MINIIRYSNQPPVKMRCDVYVHVLTQVTALFFFCTVLAVMWLVPHEAAAVSAHSVYTIQPCTMSGHLMRSHICSVHACLSCNGAE